MYNVKTFLDMTLSERYFLQELLKLQLYSYGDPVPFKELRAKTFLVVSNPSKILDCLELKEFVKSYRQGREIELTVTPQFLEMMKGEATKFDAIMMSIRTICISPGIRDSFNGYRLDMDKDL